jgi:hypothetical protein
LMLRSSHINIKVRWQLYQVKSNQRPFPSRLLLSDL